MNIRLQKIGIICIFLLVAAKLEANPSIYIPVKEHQFYASQGNTDRWHMEIQNGSGLDVIIHDIAFPDSCHFNTVANFPYVIRSGDLTTLPIDFISPGLGDFDCVAYVLTNDQYQDSIPIELHGTGLYTGPEIILITEEVLFDEARIGSSNAAFLRFYNFGDANVVIDSFELHSEHFWIGEYQELPTIVESLENCKLQIWFMPEEAGSYADTLWIFHNDSLGKTPIPLKGEGAMINYINGSPIWFDDYTDAEVISRCGDINKDGFNDIINFDWSPDSLTCLNVNASHITDVIWSVCLHDSIELENQHNFLFSTTIDYNNDSFEDILLFCYEDFYQTGVISGKNGKFLKFDTIAARPEGFGVSSFRSFFDFDQDGVDEIVFGDSDNEDIPGIHKTYCFDYIHDDLLWSTELEMQIYGMVPYADLNDDNYPELLVYGTNQNKETGRFATINGMGGSCLGYTDFETERLLSLRKIDDINEDGFCELLISDKDYRTYIFDLINNEILFTEQIPYACNGNFIEIGDLDGDGFNDYIPTKGSDSLFAISGYSAKYIWKEYLNDYSYISCLIDDVTYDGFPEIIVSPRFFGPYPQYFLNAATGKIIKSGINVSTTYKIIPVEDINGDGLKDFISSVNYGLLLCQSGAIGVYTDNEASSHIKNQRIISFPNPFNDGIEFSFSLESKEIIKLSILDINGSELKCLLEKEMQKGQHTVYWYGTDAIGHELPTGIYFVSLNIGDHTTTEKIIKQ